MLFLSSGSNSTRISFTPTSSRRTAASKILIASFTEGGFCSSAEHVKGTDDALTKNSRRSIFVSPLCIANMGYNLKFERFDT